MPHGTESDADTDDLSDGSALRALQSHRADSREFGRTAGGASRLVCAVCGSRLPLPAAKFCPECGAATGRADQPGPTPQRTGRAGRSSSTGHALRNVLLGFGGVAAVLAAVGAAHLLGGLALAALPFLAPSTTSSPRNSWGSSAFRQQFEQSFVKSCAATSSGQESACNCMLPQIENLWTPAQAATFSIGIAAGGLSALPQADQQAIVAIAAACGAGASPQVSVDPVAPSASSVAPGSVLLQANGSGDRQTDNFSVVGQRVRICWNVGGTDPTGGSDVRVTFFVYPSGGSAGDAGDFDAQQPGQGCSFANMSPGSYYVKAVATSWTNWSVTVTSA
jgi:hypothetical protein